MPLSCLYKPCETCSQYKPRLSPSKVILICKPTMYRLEYLIVQCLPLLLLQATISAGVAAADGIPPVTVTLGAASGYWGTMVWLLVSSLSLPFLLSVLIPSAASIR